MVYEHQIEAAGKDWIAARDIDDESGRVYLAYFEDKGEMEGYLTNWSSDKEKEEWHLNNIGF